jgi:RNA polymerase sigma-70 factor (ECF subfamily)
VADVEAWFLEHRGHLFRYLCRAVGQADMARDLTQDVFVRAAGSRASPTDGADARAWLFTIARNLALDHHRRQRVAERPDAQPAGTTAAATPATQELAAVVNDAIGALSDLDRDVFLMRETAGLGYAEIAKVCDLTPEAVRSRIHRARLELRRRLGGEIRSRRGLPAPPRSSREP